MRAIGASGCDRDFSVTTLLGHGRRPCAHDRPWPHRIGVCARSRSWVVIENSLSCQILACGKGFMTRQRSSMSRHS